MLVNNIFYVIYNIVRMAKSFTADFSFFANNLLKFNIQQIFILKIFIILLFIHNIIQIYLLKIINYIN